MGTSLCLCGAAAVDHRQDDDSIFGHAINDPILVGDNLPQRQSQVLYAATAFWEIGEPPSRVNDAAHDISSVCRGIQRNEMCDFLNIGLSGLRPDYSASH